MIHHLFLITIFLNITYLLTCREDKPREAGEEDGEIKEEVDQTKYNMDKLIEWAGFNSPLPEAYTDETRKYRAMSYSAVKTLKVCNYN